MFELSELVRPYFEHAGWVPRHLSSMLPVSSREKALALLNEFGGLKVGSVGPGADMSKSDINFYAHFKPGTKDLLRSWERQIGEVEAVATAHHDHMIIYVGVQSFYVFTDPDDKLYDLGPNFSQAMEKLLLGLHYGTSMNCDG
jgi:hypothetical protein